MTRLSGWVSCARRFPETSAVTRRLFLAIALLVLASAFAGRAGEGPRSGPATEKRFPPLKLPPGFQATLFACDPFIEYPSVIAAGPKANSLFVAIDYMT